MDFTFLADIQQQHRGMAILIVPVLVFFGWLAKKHPTKVKKVALISAIATWSLLIVLIITLYVTDNL